MVDLLDETGSSQRWLDEALERLRLVDSLAPVKNVIVRETEQEQLRVLRSEFSLALSAASDPGSIQHPIISSATAVSIEAGQIRLHATGGGLDLIRSYLLVQLVKASYRGTLRRLKICANPECAIAFFDRSKNCSRLWHDVATCGNSANVRAYRQRLREREAAAAQSA
ncbi:CGNR zinc finger domain-containing protein [Arthrobacter sp. NPDC080031]|uniref:CGNR zinc finger domain-containing protein n=1 Tax=Arthrobacter sp. NPDC080031 TaxID=3155918 RepID=UPI00344F2E92